MMRGRSVTGVAFCRSIQLDNYITRRNMIGMDNSEQRPYLPVSDRAAGYVVAAFMLVCCLIVASVGLAVMVAFG